jgi:hypothetical protein
LAKIRKKLKKGKKNDEVIGTGYLFGPERNRADQIGYIESDTRAIFGRSYATVPAQLIKELAADEAIQEAPTLLLTVPNTRNRDLGYVKVFDETEMTKS